MRNPIAHWLNSPHPASAKERRRLQKAGAEKFCNDVGMGHLMADKVQTRRQVYAAWADKNKAFLLSAASLTISLVSLAVALA